MAPNLAPGGTCGAPPQGESAAGSPFPHSLAAGGPTFDSSQFPRCRANAPFSRRSRRCPSSSTTAREAPATPPADPPATSRNQGTVMPRSGFFLTDPRLLGRRHPRTPVSGGRGARVSDGGSRDHDRLVGQSALCPGPNLLKTFSPRWRRCVPRIVGCATSLGWTTVRTTGTRRRGGRPCSAKRRSPNRSTRTLHSRRRWRSCARYSAPGRTSSLCAGRMLLRADPAGRRRFEAGGRRERESTTTCP